jgi:hypothetical protein
MKKLFAALLMGWGSLFADIDLRNPEEVIVAIVNTNHHIEPGMKVAKLYDLTPEFFNDLKEDVLKLISKNRPSDVGKKEHVTNWTKPWGYAIQYSLLNASGLFDDTSVDHNSSIFNKAFHHAEEYPFLNRFIEMFPHATNFRINVMGPQSGLSQHEECSCMGNHKGEPIIRARFHLPIRTNHDVNMFVDGDVFSFKEGSIYFFNNGGIHSTENNHFEEERVHLVWDMLLTQDTFNRMFARTKYPQDMLIPSQEWKLIPSFHRSIDPNYAANSNWYSLETERFTQLCDVQ